MYVTAHQPYDFEIVSDVSEHYLDTVWLNVGPGMTLQFSVEEAEVMVTQIEDALAQLRTIRAKLFETCMLGPDAATASAKLD